MNDKRRRVRGKLLASGLVLLALSAAAFLAPWLSPYSPSEQDLLASRQSPSSDHWLGTDVLGRDVLSRMIWGTRVSLAVGVVVVGLEILIGAGIGVAAGYRGGWWDLIALRVADVTFAFPPLLFAILIVALLGPNLLNILLALMIVGWPELARLTRSEVLGLRELEFVLASRALGASSARTILCHVLPNAVGPILVAGAFAVAAAILTESAISFLGFGVVEPVPSWGALINESKSASHWWVQVFPGLLIFLTVTCFNLFGEGLRDALDPRGRAR